MAKQVQLRRGTTSEHSTFTGAVGEVTVDTTKDTLVVHDGSTAGGIPLARQSSVDLKAPIASPVFTGDLRAERLLAHGSGGISTNVAVGQFSLDHNTTGVANIAVGVGALRNNSIGNDNVAFGHHSLINNTTGSYNMAIGEEALGQNITGSSNFAVGLNALKYKQNGDANTNLSKCIGVGQSTRVGGDYATAIGYAASAGEKATAIGYNASAPANCVALGTSSERTLVGGAVDNGTDKLQVNGSISTSAGYGRILTKSGTKDFYSMRVLNVPWLGGETGSFTFNPLEIFGTTNGGGMVRFEVNQWQTRFSIGYILWRNDGNNGTISSGLVQYIQLAYQTIGVSVSCAEGNDIVVTLSGMYANSHGWGCRLIA